MHTFFRHFRILPHRNATKPFPRPPRPLTSRPCTSPPPFPTGSPPKAGPCTRTNPKCSPAPPIPPPCSSPPPAAAKPSPGFLPTLAELADGHHKGLHTLYISPLKALTADIRRNLRRPVEGANLPIRIEDRTGDTTYTQRRRQRADPPHILLTTPESLALLLSYEDAPRIFANLSRVIIDELHALAESKRGDQLMLQLARLATLAPGLRRIGLSATVEDPPALARFLASETHILQADPGPDPDIAMLVTDTPPPWAGGGGKYAIPGDSGTRSNATAPR